MVRRGPFRWWSQLVWLALGLACARAGDPTPLTTIRVVDSLVFPLFVTHAPNDFQRVFIVEQSGRIKIRTNGAILPTSFLDIDALSSCCGERGLLGLAFHPDYVQNGWFYINYTNNAGDTVIARYSVSADPNLANPAATIVLTYDSSPPTSPNHNGGWLAFGPDGYLYIASGDGGDHFDPLGNGQDITAKLLGKLLRIDVNGDDFPDEPNRNYAIPPDNPFVGLVVVGDDEIWAYGLRNPWRCAFDVLTGDLYIADVGEEEREEINFQAAGGAGGANYGWRCMEGNRCTGLSGCVCDSPTLTQPIHEYEHGGVPFRCSITGGEVYRGCAIPDLSSSYFYADYCSQQIWSLIYDPPLGVTNLIERAAELDPSNGLNIHEISSFGRDAAGEMYVCDRSGGEVFKIVPDVALTILGSDPPSDAIDARRPIDPISGAQLGWSALEVTFAQNLSCLTELDYVVRQTGEPGTPPFVTNVTLDPADHASIVLNRTITPLSWTTITHEASAVVVRLGFLPADVDANGTADPLDVSVLVESLTPPGVDRPIASTDIDRSGLTAPADILETIDLLNGAGDYDAYNGATLP